MKQKRNKWVVRLNTKQRPSRGGGHTDKKEKNERRCTPLLQEQNLFFFGWKINLSFKTKTILDQAICFFSSLSLPSVLPRATDARAQEATRELSLRLGRKKIDFVRTWGRCSLSSSPSPWLYIYLDGINVTLCVCVTEKVRVSSQNEERSARKARKLRETETH